MKKIPTLFLRDFANNPKVVTAEPNPACAWVFAGEGDETVKLDGTCARIQGGRLFKRRELRPTDSAPVGFEEADFDEKTGKRVGWVPVGDGPDDRYFREAFERFHTPPADGTFELIGPKVQGNPEKRKWHELVRHGLLKPLEPPPRTYEGLRDWLAAHSMEGLVWHHPDGRMAKIKGRDFGLKRQSPSEDTSQ